MGYAVNKDIYREEALDLLIKLESSLMTLEENPDNKDLINNIFRYLHTIKGSGSMFGFDKIASFTHEFETVFNEIRNGNCKAEKELMCISLSALDCIKKLLYSDETEDCVFRDEILRKLRGFRFRQKTDAGNKKILKIEFKPSEDVFIKNLSITSIFNDLMKLGECRIIACTDRLPNYKEFNSENCYLYWYIFLITSADESTVKDIFIFLDESSEFSIKVIPADSDVMNDNYKMIGEILLDNGEISEDKLKIIKDEQKLFGTIAMEKGLVSKDKIETAVTEQELGRKIIQEKKSRIESSTIRVNNEKLDVLINLVGEFVTNQARLIQESVKANNKDIISISENLGRLTENLRDITMNIRMVPFSEMFTGFTRLIHDLSNSLNKNIGLITSGGETEIDKNLIDSLKDPLMHIIRNCADHGIESCEQRKKKGKPERGTISITASHTGSNIEITVSDDGSGLDIKRIKEKALSGGLINGNDDEEKIINTIFEPGFSTNEEVTEYSGRGVGMDVVKKNVEQMRGSIKVKTKENEGTAITITIPLTLAIIDGLLTSVNDNYYLLDLCCVEECVDMTKDILSEIHLGSMINIRGHMIPYLRVRDLFNVKSGKPDIECMVVTMFDGKKMGLIFDRVIGKHQTVIKPLSSAVKNIKEISGATILGDGTVALIMDVNTIINKNYLSKAAAAKFL